MNQSDVFNEAILRFQNSIEKKIPIFDLSFSQEEKLRTPFVRLIEDIAPVLSMSPGRVDTLGETFLPMLSVRPDFAIVQGGLLIGFVELKAPGKGSNPKTFKGDHDATQWKKLQRLPNLIYTDGQSFSLWREGQLIGKIHSDLKAETSRESSFFGLRQMFSIFFNWQPSAPKTVKALAITSAKLCRLLRDEVAEQLSLGAPTLTSLATDWRKLLFPDVKDSEFSDGYAQAVTFGLLVAKTKGISLATGLAKVAADLIHENSIIGGALRILTHDTEDGATLTTSLQTMIRVFDAVNWELLSKGETTDWIYFYEDFLAAYDKDLRRKTGSYYTPRSVVSSMTRLVDDALKSPLHFGISDGLAASELTIADPAMGTGTFLLEMIKTVAATTEKTQGAGAVPGAIKDMLKRIIGFEIQFGPFAVAQLRLVAELKSLGITLAPRQESDLLRLHITDTLSDPDAQKGWLPNFFKPLAESGQKADLIKREENITIVLGNPPYKDKAKGRGGWIAKGTDLVDAPLALWFPPKEWSVGAHTKHLHNLYIYFWRWATRKVFGDSSAQKMNKKKGVVCFITCSGFLNGPGFQAMRKDLRSKADTIWIINCSPEGLQPPVKSRIFEAVQQPICIVMAIRTKEEQEDKPATAWYFELPKGPREEKLKTLSELSLDTDQWETCSKEWRSSFLPRDESSWSTYFSIDQIFVKSFSGVMPGRQWIIAPDQDTLIRRWNDLISESNNEKKSLKFHPHTKNGMPGDKHLDKETQVGLQGHELRTFSVAKDKNPCISPVRYGYSSFDRQWIIPDNRLINRSSPTLWNSHSPKQIYLATLDTVQTKEGPSITFSKEIPDISFFKGSEGGRVFPLYLESQGSKKNINASVLKLLESAYGIAVQDEEVMFYVAAVVSHPFYGEKFKTELRQPKVRVPLTYDHNLFKKAVSIGRKVVAYQTFDLEDKHHSDDGLSKIDETIMPFISKAGSISSDPNDMPDQIIYDKDRQKLHLGTGYIDNVSEEIWNFKIHGNRVLKTWFKSRQKNRKKPIIGDRKKPSELELIQSEIWRSEYTKELLLLMRSLKYLSGLANDQSLLLIDIINSKTIKTVEPLSLESYCIESNESTLYRSSIASSRKESHKTGKKPTKKAKAAKAPKEPRK